MRKLLLIAAMVLVSATAQAGSRSLTLAANDEPAAAPQPRAVEQQPVVVQPATPQSAEAPRAVEAPAATPAPNYVARPAPVEAAALAPQAEPTKPVAKVEKPKRRRDSTEARVIYELHRHGIYW